MATAVFVDYINEHRDRFGVERFARSCAGLKIAPSTYYAARTRPLSARAVRDEPLKADIAAVHADNLGACGAEKVHADLNREGVSVACCTAERPIRELELQGLGRNKTIKITSVDGAETERPADLGARAFTATAPNQLWVAGLTYIRTHAGWAYAAWVIGVFSRLVVGWQVSTSLSTELALDALDMRLWQPRRNGQGTTRLIHHSDRGALDEFNRSSQYLVQEVSDGSPSAGSGQGGSSDTSLAGASEVPEAC